METQILSVKTFTCKYDDKEDRLVLTLNYLSPIERVDFWITRSFLLKLIPVFFDFMQQSTQDNTPINNQLPTPTDSSMYILTQKESLLLESMDFKRQNNATVLVFKNLTKAVLYEAILDENGIKNFVNLILKSVPRYEWGIYNI